jgi:hypothetical protein
MTRKPAEEMQSFTGTLSIANQHEVKATKVEKA